MADYSPSKPNVEHLRSHHWPAVRAAHLQREPACVACGNTEHLQVHHVRPFHLHPDLELDQANLITLCEAPDRHCHLIHGHALHWHGYNPHVRADAEQFRQRIATSERLARQSPTGSA